MRIASWRNILFVGTASLFVLYLFWWNRMIQSPIERSSADFIHFYSAGRIAQVHGFTSVYNVGYQKSVEEEVVGLPLADQQVLLYNHMPYLVPLLALVVNNNYAASFERWGLILVILYLFAIQILIGSLFAMSKKDIRLAIFLCTITFFPLFISLWQGQDTAFLYLGIVCWCIGIIKKQDWLIGVGLALATIRPHICIALAIPLLFKKQRAWWYSVLLVSLLAVISVMLVKVQGVVEFVNLLRITSQGTWFGMRQDAMFNLLGFILRIMHFQNASINSVIGWLIYLTGVVTISMLWRRSNTIDNRVLGLSILMATITAPVLHLHDLTLLIFPLLFIVRERLTTSSGSRWILFPLGASFFLILGIVMDVGYFIFPYVLFVLFAWLLVDHSRGTWVAQNQDVR